MLGEQMLVIAQVQQVEKATSQVVVVVDLILVAEQAVGAAVVGAAVTVAVPLME
jgi:hypothetical protein